MIAIVCTTVLLLAAVEAYKLPSFIKPCARNDPNFDDCALKHGRDALPAFMKGDRKYKIPRMDPLEITEMSVQDGPKQSGFTLTMRDVKLRGLKDAILEDVHYDFYKKHIEFHTKVPLLTIVGQYEIGGRILVLPITGNGDINITLVDNKLSYTYDYALKKRNAVDYVVTKNPKATVEPTTGFLHLTNLFNGDKLLGNQMNEFMNENFHDVYRSMSPAVSEAFAQAIDSIVDNISSVLPYDVVFPEKLP